MTPPAPSRSPVVKPAGSLILADRTGGPGDLGDAVRQRAEGDVCDLDLVACQTGAGQAGESEGQRAGAVVESVEPRQEGPDVLAQGDVRDLEEGGREAEVGLDAEQVGRGCVDLRARGHALEDARRLELDAQLFGVAGDDGELVQRRERRPAGRAEDGGQGAGAAERDRAVLRAHGAPAVHRPEAEHLAVQRGHGHRERRVRVGVGLHGQGKEGIRVRHQRGGVRLRVFVVAAERHVRRAGGQRAVVGGGDKRAEEVGVQALAVGEVVSLAVDDGCGEGVRDQGERGHDRQKRAKPERAMGCQVYHWTAAPSPSRPQLRRYVHSPRGLRSVVVQEYLAGDPVDRL